MMLVFGVFLIARVNVATATQFLPEKAKFRQNWRQMYVMQSLVVR